MDQEHTRSTHTRIAIAVVIALTLVVLVLCWRSPNRSVPEYLLGEWHTTEAQHADRYFEITQVSVSFTTGEGSVYTGFIKDIRQVQEGTRTLYTVVYDVDGTLNELSFYYEPANGAGIAIRFKNQENIIWTRSEGS